jgi:hypothetical protein
VNSKEYYQTRTNAYMRSFMELAGSLGYPKVRTTSGLPSEADHPVVRLMGSLAYGRHDAESGANTTKESAIVECSWLRGYWAACKRLAAQTDRTVFDVMRRMEDTWRQDGAR